MSEPSKSFTDLMRSKVEQRSKEAATETLPIQKLVPGKGKATRQVNVRMQDDLLHRIDRVVLEMNARAGVLQTRSSYLVEALTEWVAEREAELKREG